MRFIRFLLSIAAAVVLIASAGAAMGSFATEEAISEEAIEKAIVETGAIDQMTDSILMQNTTNMGGQYGQTMKEILKSDAMTDFFTAYTADSLADQFNGDQGAGYYNEIGSDDLNAAFSKGIDECISKGSITMDEGERQLFDTALNEAMPTLTEGVNYVIQQMNLTGFVNEDTEKTVAQVTIIMSPAVRYGSIGIALAACLLLILLRHHRRTGLMWCGISIMLVAALLYVFSIMASGTEETSANFISLSGRMMYIMLAYGMEKTAIAGGIIGVAFLPANFITSRFNRRKAA